MKWLIGSLSKLKNLFARTFLAFVLLSGENPMSHLMSSVLRFQLQAELKLKLCAKGKTMANSTLKRPFKVKKSGNLYFARTWISFRRARNFLVDFQATIPEALAMFTTGLSSSVCALPCGRLWPFLQFVATDSNRRCCSQQTQRQQALNQSI